MKQIEIFRITVSDGQPPNTQLVSGCEIEENSEFQYYSEQRLWNYENG
jgi:hypothetical protein